MPIRGSPSLRPHAASAAVVLCVGSAAVAAWGAPSDAAFGRGLLQLLVVGLPIAAGLYAVRSPANRRFGTALLILGVAWSLTALGEASLSVPYTIGRAATWFLLPSVFYLLLAFPHGRLADGLDRALFCGVVAVAVLLFFATAFVVQAFPLITPWASCASDCPANALFVLRPHAGVRHGRGRALAAMADRPAVGGDGVLAGPPLAGGTAAAEASHGAGGGAGHGDGRLADRVPCRARARGAGANRGDAGARRGRCASRGSRPRSCSVCSGGGCCWPALLDALAARCATARTRCRSATRLATALSDPTLELLYRDDAQLRLARCQWMRRRLATGPWPRTSRHGRRRRGRRSRGGDDP